MKTFFTVLLVFGLLAVLAVSGCQSVQSHVITEGSKVGSVIKLSQQGVFASCKSWEGELIRGGLNGGGGAFSITPLHFTVNDPNLLREVNTALEQQYEVEVTYVEFLGPMPCASNSKDVFLTGIHRR